MKLLVTGGCGFIGTNFIKHIVSKYPDYKIVNIDKLTYAGNRENLRDIEKNKNYKFIKGDICDMDLVFKTVKMELPDAIINFAAETHVDRSIMEPDAFIKTDIYGTYVLLESVRKFKINKYIHISTDEVYGSITDGSFKETSALNPSSPYSASKASADLLCLSYRKTYNAPVIIVRPSNNFGPYQYPEKIIPLFITNALEGKSLPLYGDGKNIRDWMFVWDCCEAIDLILHKGKIGEIYNVAGKSEMTNFELTKKILNFLNKPHSLIKFVKDRPAHDRRYSLDIEKIKNLGWKAKYSFNEALKITINWYKENKSWWKKIKLKRSYKSFYKKHYLSK